MLSTNGSADIDEVSTVFVYPPPSKTDPSQLAWLGGIAVRENGMILTTNLLVPNVTMYDPLAEPVTPYVLHAFEAGTGLTSLTETLSDVFEISVGNFTLAASHSSDDIESITAKPGSVKIYRLDLRHDVPVVTLTASLPRAKQINNLATLDSRTILGSDSAAGIIWRIDTITGAYTPAYNDSVLAPLSQDTGSILGVNGLKVAKGDTGTYLYFTNSATSIFARVQIDAETGVAIGSAEIISKTLGAAKGVGYDSFALQYSETCSTGPVAALLCDFLGNAVEYVPLADPSEQFLIAGSVKSNEVAGPSDAAFGRTDSDTNVLYVSTTGGILNFNQTGNQLIGGQILAINTTNQQVLAGKGSHRRGH